MDNQPMVPLREVTKNLQGPVLGSIIVGVDLKIDSHRSEVGDPFCDNLVDGAFFVIHRHDDG
jgi:hypothetical protein